MRRRITISVNAPYEASDADIALFIEEALSSWGGGLHPDHSLFHSLEVRFVNIRGTKYTFDKESE